MKGLIYNFFPVEIEKNEMGCTAIKSWQWEYFTWLFYSILYSRQFVAILFNIEQPPFIIKIIKK